jgi:hypothetical protein
MEAPLKTDPEKNDVGTTARSSAENFEQATATIPNEISSDAVPEILAPGQEAEGWPIWDVQQITSLPFFLLSKRYGEFWELDNDEKTAVARAWKPVLDRYLPLKGESELGTAAIVTLAIMAPRLVTTDWKNPKRKGNGKPTAPVSTVTAGSGESPASSESENRERVPAWGIFSEVHDA